MQQSETYLHALPLLCLVITVLVDYVFELSDATNLKYSSMGVSIPALLKIQTFHVFTQKKMLECD